MGILAAFKFRKKTATDCNSFCPLLIVLGLDTILLAFCYRDSLVLFRKIKDSLTV